MLGESDLMALDEDLQDVPWGLMSGEQQQQRQILSPIAALTETQVLTGLSSSAFSEMAQWRGITALAGDGWQRRSQALLNSQSGLSSPTEGVVPSCAHESEGDEEEATPSKADTSLGGHGRRGGRGAAKSRAPKAVKTAGSSSQGRCGGQSTAAVIAAATAVDEISEAPGTAPMLIVPTPTKATTRHLLHGRPPLAATVVGRRISFSTPSPATSPTVPFLGAKEEDERAASPFAKYCKRSASPFNPIKPPPAGLDTLRNINLMVNRVSTKSPAVARGRPPKGTADASASASSARPSTPSSLGPGSLGTCMLPTSSLKSTLCAAFLSAGTLSARWPRDQSISAALLGAQPPPTSVCPTSVASMVAPRSVASQAISPVVSSLLRSSVADEIINLPRAELGPTTVVEMGAAATPGAPAPPPRLQHSCVVGAVGSGTLHSFGGLGGALLSCLGGPVAAGGGSTAVSPRPGARSPGFSVGGAAHHGIKRPASAMSTGSMAGAHVLGNVTFRCASPAGFCSV